jgi:hypothetical protein
LYVAICFSFAAFKILFLSLTFENLIIMCLGEDLFIFNLFGSFGFYRSRGSFLFLDFGSFLSCLFK